MDISDTSPTMDWALDMYVRRGLALHVILWPEGEILPKYADVKTPWYYPKEEAGTRAAYASLARKYGAKTLLVEIYNEPDGGFWEGTVEEFAANHRWAYEEFRRNAPTATLSNGGYCNLKPDVLAQIVPAVKGQLDWVAIHTHGPMADCRKTYEEFMKVHRQAGYDDRTPWFNTEMGFTCWRADIQQFQAYTALQKLLFYWSRGFRGVSVYEMRDQAEGEWGVNWGALDHWFCPRFQYPAIAAFIETYAGARHEATLADGPELYVNTFRRGDQTLVACFSLAKEPAPLTLETDARSAKLVDEMGNQLQADQCQGRVTLQPMQYPRTLVLDGATRVAVLPSPTTQPDVQ